MSFDSQAFLAQHNGDAVAALTALDAQRAQAQEGRDSEGQAAVRARRERDEARSRTKELEAQLTELNAYRELGSVSELTTNLDVLDTLQEAITGAGITSGDVPAQVGARLARAADADQLERTVAIQRAASGSKVSEDELTEWLGGRALVSGKVKDKEGKEVDSYGLTVRGDDGHETFKPLSEFGTFQKLAQASPVTPRWTTQDQQRSQLSRPEQLDAQLAASGQYQL